VHARSTVSTFLWWSATWSALFRGYGLAALIYFVVDADLEPLQLVLLGTALEVSVLLAEIPTGVVADTLSRKRSIVISHVVMGVAFVLVGTTTEFVPLLLTQVMWGVGWTFTSGADVAWITDELDDGARIDGVLAARARWNLLGGVVGYAVSGALAWAFDLSTAIMVFGVGMVVTGLWVALRFTEHNFTPVTENRLRESLEIFRKGVSLSRRDSQILLVLGATLTLNSGAEAVDRLFNRRLVDLGFPESANPVVWFTLLGVIGLLAGAVALRYIETRVNGDGAARRFYMYGVALAIVGTFVLAWAPNVWVGVAGTFVVRGLGWAIIPAVAAIWVNRRTTSNVRATVQSFLGQAESIGEITGGIALGVVAQASSLSVALTGSAGLFLFTLAIVARSRAGRREPVITAV
jgi:MFS family permease